MKRHLLRPFSFIGKSLLWSVVLYISFMVIFNWDDVSAGYKKYRTGVNIAQVQPPQENNATPQINSDEKHSVFGAAIGTIGEIAKLIFTLHK